MIKVKEPIAEVIWERKYRYQWQGKVIDQTMDDTWRRVAKAVARAERGPLQRQWEQAFYRLLFEHRFLPGGRILAGAGRSIRRRYLIVL